MTGALRHSDVMTTKARWFGQSAFLITAEKAVLIDPFGVPGPQLAERGLQFAYPPIERAEPDLVLITHEHFDHNGAEVAGGEPVVLRSTAGKLESPVGEVVAIASEHDDAAGTSRGPNTIFCFTLGGLRHCHMGDFGQAELRDAQREAIGEVIGIASEHDPEAGIRRGPNTIFCFTLDGVRFCHLGDFGQSALRPEQREAIGRIDLLFVPVGGGPTIGGAAAAELVRELGPRIVVPMHYGHEGVDFLEPPDVFLEALGARVERADSSEVELDGVAAGEGSQVVLLLAPPLA